MIYPVPAWAAVDDHVQKSWHIVEGWCSPAVADMLKIISEFQRGKSSGSGVAEIGIHHGKLFMLMNATCFPDEKSYAIDIFDDQDLNIDHSGLGSKSIFLQNLAKFDAHAGSNVELVEGDSTNPELAKRIPSGIRIFSVDGGHTVEHTINDLELASQKICPLGVVILDDILNHHWLGVVQGVLNFLGRRPTLVPFAIGHNKLLMCKLSYRQKYYDLFASSPLVTKLNVDFGGYPLVAM